MTPELCRVILFAKDMRRMTAFYRDVLGLAPRETDEPIAGWLVLQAGGCELALHQIPEPIAAGIEIDDPPQVRAGTPIKVCFTVDDVAKTWETLVARGVQMLTPPAVEEGVMVRCDGVDPEGNVFQLFRP